MIKLMQQIYRRWLSRYRWANAFRAWFLRRYFHYWGKKLPPRVPYSKAEDNLADMRGSAGFSDAWLVKNATLLGYSRFILKEGQATYDASYPELRMKDVFADYLYQEETHLLAIFEQNNNRYLFPSLTNHAKLDGPWLSVMSASSDNWMHWLSESVPRFVIALDSMKDKKFGLLVDQQLPENMREILDIFVAGRERFEVPIHCAVIVEQLIVPAGHSGISAFWPRRPGAGNGFFYFDQDGLRLAREKVLGHYLCKPRKARKIFILRKSFFRHIANQESVELLLRSHGFEPVSPGDLTVHEQVKLFSEADVVVAQAGAALANIMFMPEESTVICLSVRNEHVNYDYFRDYAKTFKVNLMYVLGELDDPGKYDETHIGKATHPMNAEFTCPEKELLDLLGKLS